MMDGCEVDNDDSFISVEEELINRWSSLELALLKEEYQKNSIICSMQETKGTESQVSEN